MKDSRRTFFKRAAGAAVASQIQLPDPKFGPEPAPVVAASPPPPVAPPEAELPMLVQIANLNIQESEKITDYIIYIGNQVEDVASHYAANGGRFDSLADILPPIVEEVAKRFSEIKELDTSWKKLAAAAIKGPSLTDKFYAQSVSATAKNLEKTKHLFPNELRKKLGDWTAPGNDDSFYSSIWETEAQIVEAIHILTEGSLDPEDSVRRLRRAEVNVYRHGKISYPECSYQTPYLFGGLGLPELRTSYDARQKLDTVGDVLRWNFPTRMYDCTQTETLIGSSKHNSLYDLPMPVAVGGPMTEEDFSLLKHVALKTTIAGMRQGGVDEELTYLIRREFSDEENEMIKEGMKAPSFSVDLKEYRGKFSDSVKLLEPALPYNHILKCNEFKNRVMELQFS